MISIGLDLGREAHQFHIIEGKRTLETGVISNASWAVEPWVLHVEATYGTGVQLAIESVNGLATPLDQFVEERGWRVLQIPPSTVKSYRENVMGQQNKTDATDAYALAALANDAGERFQSRKQPRRALRRLTRQRQALIKEQTQTINRLRCALAAAWPEATEALVPDLTAAYILTILERHPDPAEIASLGVQGLRLVLRSGPKSCGTGVTNARLQSLVDLAASNTIAPAEKRVILAEVRFLVRRVRHLVDDLRELESIMAEAIAGDKEAARIDQLAGISTVAAATFMGEVQDIQNFESERKLASYAGLGLVRRQTGKTLNRNRAQMRSNRQLKLCIHNMALGRLFHHAESKEYYNRKRSEGKNHKQALRALARHLLRLLYRTLQPPRVAA